MEDPNFALDLDRDETSDIEEAATFHATPGGGLYATVADAEEEEESYEDLVEEDLALGEDLGEYRPLEDQHHEREIFLPHSFYSQRQRCFPEVDNCAGGCSEDCMHGTAQRAQEGARYDLPLMVFQLFFSDAVFEMLAAATNAYAAFKDAGGPGHRQWRDTTAAELKIWLGLIIYMGVVRQGRVDEFWYRQSDWPQHGICRFLGHTRFNQIKRFFHISAPFAHLPQQKFYEKLEPLASLLKEAFMRVVRPATQVSIDEMIVRFKGRSKHTIMMRGKPVPVGYNILSLCERGYRYCFCFTSPAVVASDDIRLVPNSAPEAAMTRLLSKLAKSVLYLCKQLPYATHFFQLYCDNLFSSPDLFHVLRAYGIAATGTARATCRNWPRIFRSKINRKKTRIPFNTQYSKAIHGDVAAVIWQDKNLVQFCTTAHDPASREYVSRRRPVAKTAWLRAAVAEHWGGMAHKVILQPTYAIDYNNHMNSVDLHDQLRSYASTQLKALRCWMALFFFMLDAAVVNAYIVTKELYPTTKDPYISRQRSFRLRLAWCLVLSGSREQGVDLTTRLRAARDSEGRYTSANRPAGNTTKSRTSGYISKNWQPPAIRLSIAQHSLDSMLSTFRNCSLCRYYRKLDPQRKVRTTRRYCSICGDRYPICTTCEAAWHNQ